MKRLMYALPAAAALLCLTACAKRADAPMETAAPATIAPVVMKLSTPSPAPAPTPSPEPSPTARTPQTISLRFVGDLMCCNYQIAGALLPDGNYDFTPSFASIKADLQGADMLFGNLETNVYAERRINGEKKFFNAPPAFLDAIKDCGFDALFTSNNHSLDVGVAGQLSTVREVRARGMDAIGSNLTPEEAAQIYMRDVRGVRVAALSYTGFTNKNDPEDFLLDGEDASWALNLYTPARMASDAALARESGADVVLMYLHEGWEKTTEPNRRQRAAADAAFAAGVDAVVMSHSHSLLPMEKRVITLDGAEKTVFCAYGLGNFMSSALPEEALNNIILNLRLTYDFESRRVRDIDASYLLTYTYNYYDENGVRQFVVVGMEDALLDPAANVPPLVTTNPDRVQRAYNKMLDRIGSEAATPVRSFD